MPYTVKEKDAGTHVEVILTGSVDYGAGQSLHAAVIGAAIHHQGRLLLVDATGMKGRPDVLQSIQALGTMPSEKAKLVPRMAVVDGQTSRATYIVVESMLGQMGLQAKWFADRESALEWLLKKQ